jgi:hypothetical protein
MRKALTERTRWDTTPLLEASSRLARTITKVLETAKIRTKFPRLQVQSIDVTYIGEVSGHGSGLYVRIPQPIIEYYGIVAGDRVKLRILQRKNWRDFEETATE